MDFSGLEKLGEQIRQGQVLAQQREALQKYAAGDPSALLASGNLQLANLYVQDQARRQAQANADRSFNAGREDAATAQGNADRSYGLQVRAANRADQDKFSVVNVTQPDGTQVPVRVKTTGGPEGPIAMPGASAPPLNPFSNGKMTQDQGKAATMTDRMADANTVLTKNENINDTKAGYAGGVLANVPVPGVGKFSDTSLYNYFASPARQQNIQAQRNFVNAVLRQESGAAINQSEFENAQRQYFPQPGDTSQVIEQKRQNRIRAMQGMAREAGPRYQPPASLNGTIPATPSGGSVVDWQNYFGGSK
ncbi:MAG: hypothetical protein JSS22_10265 [Proteobacteria bacterium]|nr:hypothetical protein [Pseudomonadota bacterium]